MILSLLLHLSLFMIRIMNSLSTQMSVGNDTYGITWIPFATVGGRELVQRAGLEASTRIVYPGSGREDA